MKRRALLMIMLVFMLVLAACAPPPNCPCNHIAVQNDNFDWSCQKVSEFEQQTGENLSGDDYEQCEEIAASVWLADVCEPNDGFSTDGNMTIATDLAGSTLYVAPSMEGPWTAVAASGPPWVVTRSILDGLVAQVGAANINGLWFKAGDGGYPANLGSLIANREARMDAICGG